MKTLRRVVFLAAFIGWTSSLLAQDSAEKPSAPNNLSLAASDVLVEAREDGFHLFVRQTPGVSSVMLTEAFEPSDHKLATYSFRSLTPNSVNGNETRLLNGKPLKQPHNSLISSTLEDHPPLGKAFHILIPPQVEYGSKVNPNSRYGLLDVQKLATTPGQKFWFSIRLFEKPYGDYSGAYKDVAQELKSLLAQIPDLTPDKYEMGLGEGFSRLGEAYKAKGPDDALDHIKDVLDKKGDNLDMVLVIDTTKSMVENLKIVKANLLGPIREEVKKFKSFRIGLVFFRDYMEAYLTKTVAFQTDLDVIQKELDRASADGGGDISEAVVEGLYAGLVKFDWQSDNRVLLLMGDAPQHPSPRGSVTEAMVKQAARDKNVEIQMIMLPQTSF